MESKLLKWLPWGVLLLLGTCVGPLTSQGTADEFRQGAPPPTHFFMSCGGRCGDDFVEDGPPQTCQCNSACRRHSDCCADFSALCMTCRGRCDAKHDVDAPCQCNAACAKHDDCCEDVSDVCDHVIPGTVTDVELATFSEDILTNDVNNCGSLVSINLQGSTCFSCTKDAAARPLLTVQQSAYSKPTVSKLIPLHNNYVPRVGISEDVTSQETAEEAAFLDAILATPPMQKAQKLLSDKNLLRRTSPRTNGGTNAARVFREAVHQAWFGLYSRENRMLGSSGFEHVFLGEIKDGKVSGFHNWVFFSREEAANTLNYKGRIGQAVDLGAKGKIIKHKFDWINTEKPISSMFVGTSPEFEFALYSVCFFARPGGRCPVKLNGKNVVIQTHFINRQGRRYVASAYPDI